VIDEDPELAYRHAKTARRLAARLGGVREAVAVTAYLAGHYDEALTEFRAVRRMTGNHEVLPTMADCERALGRPEKALALSREKAVQDLELSSRMEMLIVAAGARRDMGQTAAAVRALEVPELNKRVRVEWLARLRYAYADALEELGRTDDALVWFHRAAGVDVDGSTDAAERAAALEGLTFTDLQDSDDFEDSDESEVADVLDDAEDTSSEDVDAAGTEVGDDSEDADIDASGAGVGGVEGADAAGTEVGDDSEDADIDASGAGVGDVEGADTAESGAGDGDVEDADVEDEAVEDEGGGGGEDGPGKG